MAKKQFKTESKRILDLMINSIYTHKEIFLRELISNASDAIDKLYFKSLTDSSVGLSKEDFSIKLAVNKEARTITVEDNGIGMNKEDLEQNLGVIAKSGTLDFKENNDISDVDIIGQFGVGFYSAFMVADKVTVYSKAYGSGEGWKWQSSGTDGYTVTPCDIEKDGTKIELHIKEDTDDEKYSDFLSEYRISSLVRKYSDYIRYPITLSMPETRKKEGSDEYETVYELKTLNSMIPLWKRNKSELKDEDYDNFYMEKFFDFEKPLAHIHIKAEGSVCYNAVLYIPAKVPMNYYTKNFEKGLQLYANGVMIMDKCPDLVSDHFSFVRGLVDSQDLSLNISREMLQHDRQLKAIASNIEKKIKAELENMLKNDREKYEKFFKEFGLQIKFGLYSDYGMKKDELKDLVIFQSCNEKKYITLKEYTEKMKDEQKYIYYACGHTPESIALLPQTERIIDMGYDILCFTEDVDEFAIKMLGEYGGKEFKSVAAGDLGIDSDAEKENSEKISEENKEMLSFIKDALGDRISDVVISKRLKKHPVCLSSSGELSIEMEKVLNAMPLDNNAKAEKVLEINAENPVFEKLKSLFADDKEKLKEYSELLYDQALLIEGLPISDPIDFSSRICELMCQ